MREQCNIPPPGWYCTRVKGHGGPCAALPQIDNESLTILVDGLEDYKKQGVVDPWVLNDGTRIEPLDALKELQFLRSISSAGSQQTNDQE